jgi:hypothetical protein
VQEAYSQRYRRAQNSHGLTRLGEGHMLYASI